MVSKFGSNRTVVGQIQEFYTRMPDHDDSGSEVSLSHFHGFSPILGSLHTVSSQIPYSQILCLTHSLPVLEDLSLVVYGPTNDDDHHRNANCNSTFELPLFTGTLTLALLRGMGPITRGYWTCRTISTFKNSGLHGLGKMSFDG